MGLVDQLQAYAALGKGELRGAYLDHKRQIKLKADHKRAQAKTRIATAKIKADEAKEMADLEAAMYQAQIAAQNARKLAKALRHQAGHYTVGERFGQFAGGAYKVGGAFVKGLTTPERKSTRRRRK